MRFGFILCVIVSLTNSVKGKCSHSYEPYNEKVPTLTQFVFGNRSVPLDLTIKALDNYCTFFIEVYTLLTLPNIAGYEDGRLICQILNGTVVKSELRKCNFSFINQTNPKNQAVMFKGKIKAGSTIYYQINTTNFKMNPDLVLIGLGAPPKPIFTTVKVVSQDNVTSQEIVSLNALSKSAIGSSGSTISDPKENISNNLINGRCEFIGPYGSLPFFIIDETNPLSLTIYATGDYCKYFIEVHIVENVPLPNITISENELPKWQLKGCFDAKNEQDIPNSSYHNSQFIMERKVFSFEGIIKAKSSHLLQIRSNNWYTNRDLILLGLGAPPSFPVQFLYNQNYTRPDPANVSFSYPVPKRCPKLFTINIALNLSLLVA